MPNLSDLFSAGGFLKWDGAGNADADYSSQTPAQLAADAAFTGAFASLEDGNGPLAQRSGAKARFAAVTYRRAGIALRFDDGGMLDHSVVLPLLQARKLVAGFAIPSAYIGNAAGTVYDAANGTLSVNGQMGQTELLALQGAGMELMHHTATHDVNPADLADFTAETATARDAFAASGPYYVDAFVPPGPWSGDLEWDTPSKLDTPEAWVIKNNYYMADGYIDDGLFSNAYRFLPSRWTYGASHMTGDAMTLAALQAAVDKCVLLGLGLEIVFHSWEFDEVGQITTADFTSFLDYLETKQVAGVVDVLTPTGLAYATRSDTPTNLLVDGTFEASATGAFVGWIAAGSPTVSSGGVIGDKVVTSPSNQVYQYLIGQTRSVRVEAYAKATTGTAYPRMIVRVTNDAESFNYVSIDHKPGATGTTWTKVTVTCGGRPDAARLRVWLFAEAGSGDVEWSDVRVMRR